MTRRGFTFVELVLSVALIGIAAFILGPTIGGAIKGFDTVWSRRVALTETRTAMERMVREIRLIGSSADIGSVGSANFQFDYPTGTTITYQLSGTDLQRNGAVLASSVSALQFQYFDANGVTTSTPADVRRVQIRLVRAASGNHGSVDLRTSVFMRNTGNNYGNFAPQ